MLMKKVEAKRSMGIKVKAPEHSVVPKVEANTRSEVFCLFKSL
jgi:hypothetical protein